MRDYVSATRNKEQLNRQKQGKLGLHKTGKLIDEEGKLEDSVSLNKPGGQLYKRSGYRISLAPFMSKCLAIFLSL